MSEVGTWVRTIRWCRRLGGAVALALLALAGVVWADRQARALPVVATVTVGPNALPLFVDAAYGHVFVGSSAIAGDVLAGAKVTVLDTASGRVLHTLPLPAPPGSMATGQGRTPPVAAVQDGGRAYILGQANGQAPGAIMALDTWTGRLLASVSLPPGGTDA